MEEIIEIEERTVELAVPKRIFIPWEEFVENDVKETASMMNTCLATILDGSSQFYHDRHDAFDFVEPRSTEGFDLEIEDLYESIAYNLGTKTLEDREFLMDAVDYRATHEEDGPVLSDQHIQMLDVFGFPKNKDELTQKIYEYFYSDSDFYYLASKEWFYEPYLELIASFQEESCGFDRFYEVVSDCVKKRIRSTRYGGDLGVAYYEQFLSFTYTLTKEGIIVNIK